MKVPVISQPKVIQGLFEVLRKGCKVRQSDNGGGEKKEDICRKSEISPALRQSLVALGPLILTVSLGMTSGYSAVLLPQLQAPNSTIRINLSDSSWIASMAALPMAFGCILGGFLMEKFGRKTVHMITAVPCLIGWSIIAFASSINLILVGRFLTGICGGLLGPSSGVYISETSSPKFRGLLLAGISAAIALGLLFVHLLGTFFHWQTTALVATVLPIASLIALYCFSRESPAWLVRQGKIPEAQKNFFYCRGYSEEAKNEVSTLVATHSPSTNETSNEHIINYKNWLSSNFVRPLIVMVVFIVANQWSGVNAITFYTVSIMQDTLGNNFDNYLAMLIVDVIRLFASICACVLMKKMGRRPLALLSGIGTFVSLFVLSGFAYFVTNPSDYIAIPITSLVTYIAFISIGFVPLPWAMIGEVFPLKARNVGSGITSFMAFGAFFTVVKTGPAMFHNFGVAGTFLAYGTVALFGTLFVLAFLPETKDRPLHEIEIKRVDQS